MAEPPPPSYDDAILGNYSAPSSQSASAPQPSAPSFSERESTPLASRRDEQDTEENNVNSEHTSNKESCLKRSLVITWKLLLIGALVGLLALFYLMFISPSTPDIVLTSLSTPDVKRDCTSDPPYFHRGEWSYCPRNVNNKYFHRGFCELKCDKHYRFFIEDDYYTGPVYFQCVDSEWFSPASSISPACTPGNFVNGDWSKTCGSCNLIPSNPDDCKNHPPQIVEGKYYDDPYNERNEYFNGTRMSYKCNGDRVIVLPKDEWSNHDPPATRGEYICKKGKWVSGFSEIREKNKTIECVVPPISPDSCGNEPPKMPRATWIDCQQRSEFRNGEKCNFKCNGNYILSSSKMEMDDNYDREGYYTCTQGEWKSPIDESYGKLECLTITEFVKRKFG